MSRTQHVNVEEIIGEHGATDRRDPDGRFLDAHLFDDLHQHPVNGAVAATRAIAQGAVNKQRGSSVDNILFAADICFYKCFFHVTLR